MMRRRADDRKKWTSLDTFRLISEFEAMPFLWNVFDDEYKNKRLKSKAIERLACYFETSPREIHRKLHNLRCQYTSEIRKIRSRTGGPPERHQSQWSYFDSLKFLSPVVNVRSPGGSDVIGSLSCFEPGRSDNSTAGYAGDAYSDADEQEEGSSSREIKFNPLELELLRKNSDSNSDYSESNERKNLEQEIIKLDDFDIFGKLVATHLRKMPLDRAIRCQEKLFTLIMQERLAGSESPVESKFDEKESSTYEEPPTP